MDKTDKLIIDTTLIGAEASGGLTSTGLPVSANNVAANLRLATSTSAMPPILPQTRTKRRCADVHRRSTPRGKGWLMSHQPSPDTEARPSPTPSRTWISI